MEISYSEQSVSSWGELDGLLDRIESGQSSMPDWIDLDGKADPTKLDPEAWTQLLGRLHANTLRGFRANGFKIKGKRNRLAYWQRVARAGFHDFAEDEWSKNYGATKITDYDYIRAYQEGGLDAIDPYKVYSAVLGTWEYSIEDFKHTALCRDVETVVEPLAGTAEFSYLGHHRYPDMRYCMFDLDADAKARVERRDWHAQTERKFILGNALDEQVWKDVKSFSRGPSFAYIGKQSQNFFGPKELLEMMKWGTHYCDYLVLEVSEPYLVEDEPTIDEVTRPEMKAVGLHVALDDCEDDLANPLTNRMSFDLVAWDDTARRTLFEYHNWLGWQAPTLTAFGQLADLDVRYFHSEEAEFLPVEEGTDTCDCQDNNTFLLFRKK